MLRKIFGRKEDEVRCVQYYTTRHFRFCMGRVSCWAVKSRRLCWVGHVGLAEGDKSYMQTFGGETTWCEGLGMRLGKATNENRNLVVKPVCN
jgi:hypothetical protein